MARTASGGTRLGLAGRDYVCFTNLLLYARAGEKSPNNALTRPAHPERVPTAVEC